MKFSYGSRPLTEKKQLELLMDCHEYEILKLEPILNPQYTKEFYLLYQRGLVEPKAYIKTKKEFIRFFLTPSGIKTLKV